MIPQSASFNEKSSVFLSHPLEEKIILMDHLLRVTMIIDQLVSDTNLENKRISHYAALFHDMGKINPIYQYIFYNPKETRDSTKEKLLNEYVLQHSIFSAWIASKLLYSVEDVNENEKLIILRIINAHHSELKKLIKSENNNNTPFKNSKKKISEYLLRYKQDFEGKSEFSNLDWKTLFEEYRDPMHFSGELTKTADKNMIVIKFMEILLYYSSLLQSDRGSFSTWEQPKFDLNIETHNLIKPCSKLSYIRSQFQNDFKSKFNIKDDITILQAPTGIGKTKLFLDIISTNFNKNEFNKVIYLSPLLALTEDFESKIKESIGEQEMNDVLVYNHLFSGSLLQKNLDKSEIFPPSFFWNFENESF
ncbi:MAG: CRISPR-associated endonuclease Cas3'', partial [Thermoproteota archaeon]|nr:CRISPR-associated endonuclease Cas3'' [Thermoproteota archaeon]